MRVCLHVDVAVLVEWQRIGLALERDLALVEDDDPVHDGPQRAEFVLDQEDRATITREVTQHIGQGDRVRVVDRGSRLIHDKETRFTGQGASDERALLLATGQFGETATTSVGQAHRVDRAVRGASVGR
jgi:hypothetical protein